MTEQRPKGGTRVGPRRSLHRPALFVRVPRAVGVGAVLVLAAGGSVVALNAGSSSSNAQVASSSALLSRYRALDQDGEATPVDGSDPVPPGPVATTHPGEGDGTDAPPTSPATPDDVDQATKKARKRSDALAKLAEKVAKNREEANAPFSFRVATLNVLGDSHTRRGGNKSGYRSGASRTGGAVALLRSHNVDVVGLQEFEPAQKGAFTRATGGGWGVFTGSDRGANSVAWRKDTWEFVDGGTREIPYFHGNRLPMPWVLLSQTATGREAYFISIHNPISSKRRGNNEGSRDLAINLQIQWVKDLRATGRPVVLTGDFNERDEPFCRVTAYADMVAANGGIGGPSCSLPAKSGIDWIFGTSGLTFTDYVRDDSTKSRGVTDHPLVVATATSGLLP